MSRRDHYPPGAPCWVETLTADPDAAQRFYGGLFGWEFAGSGPLAGPGRAEYFVARQDGHDVAGVAPLPPPPAEPPPPAWNTHVSVADVEEPPRAPSPPAVRFCESPSTRFRRGESPWWPIPPVR
jgi:hypothetical protein